jgi:hypothetical protein
MCASPRQLGPARLERALDRIRGDCELVGRMTAVDEHRKAVRIRLEQELGPELTRALLAALASAGR